MTAKAWWWGAGAWLILRLVTTLAVTFSTSQLDAGPTVAVPGYRPPEMSGAVEILAAPWLRSDSLWYLKIATQGYRGSDSTLAFFPAYPALVAALTSVFPNELVAGLIVSNFATLAGLVLLFRFIERTVNERAARAAVVGLAVFPTAFFFVAPYAEAVLLAAGAGALLASSAGRPWIAFFTGAIAGASRPFGVLITIPMAAVIWSRPTEKSRSWPAALGPIVGLAAWVAYAAYITGDLMAAVNVQTSWQRSPVFFGETLWLGVSAWRRFAATEFGPYMLFDLVATLFGISLIPLSAYAARRSGLRRLGPGLAIYGAVALLAPLSLPFLGRPLLSNPRFVLALFPLFVAYALIPRQARIPLALLTAAGLFIGTSVFIAARPLY